MTSIYDSPKSYTAATLRGCAGGTYCGVDNMEDGGGGLPPPSGCVPAQGLLVQSGAGASTANFIPAFGLYDYGISFNLYDQSDFGSGEKRITSLTFEATGYTPGYTYVDQEVALCHFSQSSIPLSPRADLANVTGVSDFTVVKSGLSIDMTAGFKTVNFDNYFCYNGIDNLLLVWRNLDGTWASGYGQVTADIFARGNEHAAYDYQDYNPIAGNQTLTMYSRRMMARWEY
jgi:hypothetical protein